MVEGRIVRDYLKALLNTGLYGTTLAEVRQRLVCQGVERALREGLIPRAYLYIGYERQHVADTEVKG